MTRSASASLPAVLASLLALGGCAEREQGPAVVFTDSAGVPLVISDGDRPEWRRNDVWRLAAEPAIQVGNVPGDPGHLLYGAQHARRLRSGGIVVANTGLGDLRIFDAGGMPVRTIGLPNQPSGEPAQPLFVQVLGEDSVLTALGDGSLLVFGPGGGRVRTDRLAPPGDNVTNVRVAGVFGDGTLLVRGDLPFDTVQPGLRRHQIRLFRYSTTGQRLGTFGDFDMLAELVGEEVLVWPPNGHYATSDSTIWYGDAERYELREVAPDGRTLRYVRLDLEPTPVTVADTVTFKHGARAQLELSLSEDSAAAIVANYRFPAKFPEFDYIAVDELGNVWVRTFQWFDLGGHRQWRVFAADGHYLGDVLIPGLMEVYQIGADYMIGRMATSRGVEAVYIYDLIKPAPVP